jgi:KDO2-lipid IV(A) lauroyltransferase
MQFLVFYYRLPFLWIISSLFAFLLAVRWRLFLVYYIIGYRKKVVRANLALALPHLSDKERVVIEKNHTIYVTCLWK